MWHKIVYTYQQIVCKNFWITLYHVDEHKDDELKSQTKKNKYDFLIKKENL
jgi:hypothetical protein